MFDLKFSYKKKEWIRAIRRYLFLSKMITVPSIIVLLFIYASVIDLILINKFIWLAVIFASISSFLAIVYVFIYFVQPGLVYNKGGLANKEIHFTFTDDKILFVNELGSSEVTWEYYQCYLESPGSFFLEMSKNHYNIIPKRVLGTREQVNAFREMLEKHLDDSAELERKRKHRHKGRKN